MTDEITIKPLDNNDWDLAMTLVWRVFLRCNAADYEQEGIESFLNFISDEHLKQFCKLDEFEMFGAYLGHRLIGVCMLRKTSHISLLFIETEYHKRGIGRKMLRYVCALVKQRGGGSITVNATPYAKDFYKKLGFQATGDAMIKEGVRYYPMVLQIPGSVLLA